MLLDSGAVQDHANLSGMTTEEKKNLLKGLNQSKEDFSLEVKRHNLEGSLIMLSLIITVSALI